LHQDRLTGRTTTTLASTSPIHQLQSRVQNLLEDPVVPGFFQIQTDDDQRMSQVKRRYNSLRSLLAAFVNQSPSLSSGRLQDIKNSAHDLLTIAVQFKVSDEAGRRGLELALEEIQK